MGGKGDVGVECRKTETVWGSVTESLRRQVETRLPTTPSGGSGLLLIGGRSGPEDKVVVEDTDYPLWLERSGTRGESTLEMRGPLGFSNSDDLSHGSRGRRSASP